MEGGCRCQGLRFRVTAPPIITAACHCKGCQRMSSSAFSLSAFYAVDSFEVTQGVPVIGGLRGSDVHHFFCEHCMTWAFTRIPSLPHLVNTRPTLFDDVDGSAPFIETFTKTKLPWAVTGALHSFEEFPPMEAYPDLIQAFAAHIEASSSA